MNVKCASFDDKHTDNDLIAVPWFGFSIFFLME